MNSKARNSDSNKNLKTKTLELNSKQSYESAGHFNGQTKAINYLNSKSNNVSSNV